ncbi:DUF4913 domain-containing protein [Nocardia yamanashiensis]|uniref:DUF4913 domain-containing protein n=1 Tax=Nocardia yamanashiensis TaxID=209247 RepID=UPI00082FA91F|nr:DUF4913 domain-containing protein [Nocardia yamanashiensis]
MTMEFGDLDDFDDAFLGKRDPTPARNSDDEQEDDYLFADVEDWVKSWLGPATAMKLSDGGRGHVWCKEWKFHPPVVVRLDALWRAWEKARRSGDDHAMIAWFTYDYDPTMRALSEGEYGPMHACGTTRHVDIPSLPVDSESDDEPGDIAKLLLLNPRTSD